MSIVYFVLLLGALIFFHEFGHFIVARACGIRVLEFSIGFGPQVAAFEHSGTVYRIGILPLGGFVRMLKADPSEEVPPEDEADSFNNKELWKRTLVVLAGPVFNLILPFILFFCLALSDGMVAPAIVGTTTPDGVAQKAGILPGDVIKSINGDEVHGWWELERFIGSSGGRLLDVVVERNGQVLPAIPITPALVRESVVPELGLERDVGRIQVALVSRKAIIVVDTGSAAEASGLRSWDHIIVVDGKRVIRWESAYRAIRDKGSSVQVTYLSEGSLLSNSQTMSDLAIEMELAQTLTLNPNLGNGKLGLRSAEFVIRRIDTGSAVLEAGLLSGDEVLSIDGRRFALWGLLLRHIHISPGKSLVFKVRRAGQELKIPVTFATQTVKDEDNNEQTRVIVGLHNRSDYSQPADVQNSARMSYVLHTTWVESLHAFKVTLASVAGLFTGKVAFKQMGGPLTMADMASKTEKYGWTYFIKLMAWLSISLGLLNLFPIPLLDGGHLAFFLIEAVKRSPVSLKTRQIASYIGLSMIILLMVMVTKNDIKRIWPKIVGSGDADVTQTAP